MKVLVDMNLSPDWERELERHRIEAKHWSKVGPATARDRDIMAWAREHGFVVFTNDLDFGRLLALTHASGPSVIQVRTEDLLPESIGPLVVRALIQHRESLEKGALVVIDPNDFRARILPI